MSVFGKLKGLFVLEDEESTKQAAQKGQDKTTEEVKEESYSPPDITVDPSNTTPPPTGKPDSKFLNILFKAVEASNKEGFDYLEYKNSLQSLNNMEMDEATKYKSALAMATTMGVSKEKLIASANHYLSVLKTEREKFSNALKNQKHKQVTGKEDGINKVLKGIEAKKQKIEQLKKEIEADTKKVEQMKSGINQAAAKVQKTSDNFHYAYNVVSGQILSDLEKMKNYL